MTTHKEGEFVNGISIQEAIKRLKEFSNNQCEAKLIAVDISEDLAAFICGLSDCEKVDPSEVVVGKDDETLVLVFDEALGGVLNEL
ncbi:hypothetical protein Tco_0926008 [Tanacetum coccineum]|uniref:Uncharacterized protein n=1 Tax=Tanacetum coccineum TaxID=301880 RepID=A0ABQ5DFK0_9ASTR